MQFQFQFQYNDGGRRAAGYRGETNDCFIRSVVIAAELPYKQVYNMVNTAGKLERSSPQRGWKKSSGRYGVYRPTTRKFMVALGWQWTPTMGIGTGCTVHLLADELPAGRLVVSVSKHITAVIDGVIHDTADPSRNGTRCVYGYWELPINQQNSNGEI